MLAVNDNDLPEGSVTAVDVVMHRYVRMIEDSCALVGLDPEDFLRVFHGELAARGVDGLASIDDVLSLLQAKSGDGLARG